MQIHRLGIAFALASASVVGTHKPVFSQSSTQKTTAATILAQTQAVSEAQLKSLTLQKRNPLDWVSGTLWAGLAEFSHFSNRSLETDAIRQMGDKAKWKPIFRAKAPFHADDDCIGQAFLDAYARQRDPQMLEAVRADADALVAHLDASQDQPDLTWWWCDALFMAPPMLARLSDLTGDPKYLDAMDKEWWRVTAALYDPQEHLFFRDKRFLKSTTQNGHKVFWSRGNGWVLAGLVRVLTWMPRDYPNRPKYEEMFLDMSSKLLSVQGKDGAWRTSLLDAEQFPLPETSGTAFYCYGFAWGVNQGLLPREAYGPAAIRAWDSIMANRRADGLPGWVQKVGDAPGIAGAEDSQLYATGGVLLAGTELLKLVSRGVEGK
jgi:unsaturated rhamnogalacturonyl hydrolase